MHFATFQHDVFSVLIILWQSFFYRAVEYTALLEQVASFFEIRLTEEVRLCIIIRHNYDCNYGKAQKKGVKRLPGFLKRNGLRL